MLNHTTESGQEIGFSDSGSHGPALLPRWPLFLISSSSHRRVMSVGTCVYFKHVCVCVGVRETETERISVGGMYERV